MGVPSEAPKQTAAHRLQKLATAKKYQFIDAFSGPGGIGLGLSKCGFRATIAFDIDPSAVETYRGNLGDHCIVADAAQLQVRDINRLTGLTRGELDVFAGGPPCQGFSKQRRGAHLGDHRNDLILDYTRFVKELRPRFFLLENVAVFGQKRGRQYLQHLCGALNDYRITSGFYNCADYGLAQTRERFIVVGRRKDQATSFRKPDRVVETWKTVGQVIGDLPEPPLDFSDHPSFPNHQRARVTEINVRRFSHVPEGGGWQDIPHELRLKCHKRADTRTGGWPDVYGRLRWDGQCPTITGGFDSFTRGRYGHPRSDRPITPREAARLQGFPDSFVFSGTRGDIRSQIGNAVPPPLVQAIGIEIARCLLCADDEIDDAFEESSVQTKLFSTHL